MKQFLLALFSFIFFLITIQTVFAADTANINIQVRGGTQGNRYFLCTSDLGCMSIMGAQKGKIYPFYQSFDIKNIFLLDTMTRRLFFQPLPPSCKVTVDTSKTVTIHGQLQARGSVVFISQLSCKLR